MHLLDLTLPTPAENLALDEALLLEAEVGRGGPVLRFWECPRLAVVLGSGGILRDDVREDACAADGVPILRRSSGGGTVLVGPGCLCYSLVLNVTHTPELSAIRPSYCYILARIKEALGDLLPGIEVAGSSDLMCAGWKFSGNSQQRKREYLLHHGTLLYGFDLSLLDRYLNLPARQPEYRAGRAHGDFVCNLPCSRAKLQRRLQAAWQADGQAPAWPKALVQRLLAEKYLTEGWIRRR
jgi:lipoate-protein ligase A